ncbi:hypothetical protein [Kocuria sp. KH4]
MNSDAFEEQYALALAEARRQQDMAFARASLDYDEDPGLSHPDSPADYYRRIHVGELWNLRQPVPGFRMIAFDENGRIRNHESGVHAERAACIRLADSLFAASASIGAPRHDPRCMCGYRVCRDVDTVFAYFTDDRVQQEAADYFAGKHGIRVEGRNRGGYGIASVLATGHAATRDEASFEPRGLLRVEYIELTGLMVPDEWATWTDPNRIRRLAAERYGIDVTASVPGATAEQLELTRRVWEHIDGWPQRATATGGHREGAA